METRLLLSSAQVAEQLGLTRRRVLALAQSRGLGQRVGNAHVFNQRDIEAMRARKPGRPKKEKEC